MVSRRHVIAGSAGAVVAWSAPSVTSLGSAAVAQSSGFGPFKPQAFNGAVCLNSPPPNLAPGAPELDSPDFTFIWLEAGCVVLTAPLPVNFSGNGAFNGGTDDGTFVAAGSKICSYIIHGDRLDNNGALPGGATFANPIVGLIYRAPELNGSSFLENPATMYEYGPMETRDTGDVDLATNTIRWNFTFGPVTDQIRVITLC